MKKAAGEIWKTLQFNGWKHLRKKYALSSHGRIASYYDDMEKDGKILTGSVTTGYRSLNLHRPGDGTLYIHREIAKLFIPNRSSRKQYVIHLNHNKLDNAVKNLTWVTLQELVEHQQKSPAKIAYKKAQASRTQGLKLNATQVRSIKKMLDDTRRKITIKKIAEKFGVSEMTLYRIKSGENWSRI